MNQKFTCENWQECVPIPIYGEDHAYFDFYNIQSL